MLNKRFWDKIVKSKTCWFWNAAKIRGEGVFKIGTTKYVKRVLYERLHKIELGKLPLKLLCKNKGCVNPEHYKIKDTFWDKVEKTTTCWLWTGYKNKEGYGAFAVNKKNIGAHRHSYFLSNGTFDKTLNVCHSCDNPSCVNPTHLWLGSHQENVTDKMNKGRWGGSSLKGEDSPVSKLTKLQVQEIRTKYSEGGTSHRKLAKEYGVNHVTIGSIIRKRTWIF